MILLLPLLVVAVDAVRPEWPLLGVIVTLTVVVSGKAPEEVVVEQLAVAEGVEQARNVHDKT